MDSVQCDSDSDDHTDVDPDVHPASRGGLKSASVKYADAVIFIPALGRPAAGDSGLSFVCKRSLI